MDLFLFCIRKNIFFFIFFSFITVYIKPLGCTNVEVLSEYDMKTASSAASLSAFAYCNSTILAGNFTFKKTSINDQNSLPLSNPSDFITTHFIRNFDHDVSGFIGYSILEETIFVVFRGTASKKNWLNNIDTRRTDYPLCPGYVNIKYSMKNGKKCLFYSFFNF